MEAIIKRVAELGLHFTADEFKTRVERASLQLVERKLDAILLFAPESHYYLCGYDTFGFAMFQCLVLLDDGRLHLLTRTPDLRQAQHTSTLGDRQIHVWLDRESANPSDDLWVLLKQLGLQGKYLGIETRTAGLTAWNYQQLQAKLESRCTLVDASDLVPILRRRKSSTEIEYTRRAAKLSDDALTSGIAAAGAGVFEGDILAAMQGTIFKGGGDYAGNEFIIGSGAGALLCRYFSGRRHLDNHDQLTLEWSGAYCRYHAAMMRTLLVGDIDERQQRMHSVAIEALLACEEAIKPGEPMGAVFDAHANVFDGHGFADSRLNACGYGMGASYNPIWVEFPMFYHGNPQLMEAGNVFFLHMILMDSVHGLAMCWGHSVLVTETGVERLSAHKLDLVVV